MRNRIKKMLCLMLAAALVLLSVSSQASQEEIDQVKENINDSEQAIQQAEQLLSDLEQKKSDTVAYLQELSAAVNEKDATIADIQNQITTKQQEIDAAQAELTESQALADQQYEDMKLRIQYMYEAGEDELLDILFSSQSLPELLSHSEYIYQMSEYDRNMLTTYEETLQRVETAKAEMEAGQAQLTELLDGAEQEKEALSLLADAQNSKLQELSNSIAAAQGDLGEQQVDLGEQQELLEYLQAEMERQMAEALRQAQLLAEEQARAEESSRAAESAAAASSAAASSDVADNNTGNNNNNNSSNSTSAADSTTAANNNSSTASVVLTWPLPGYHRITSTFGPRPNAPVAGVAAYHNAIDIAAPNGTTIVSAGDGTVYYAGDGVAMSSQAGGYQVWVSHEGGKYITMYLHCSKLLVSAGQTVKAGDAIAEVGNTGLSAGNHLDFRILYQGSYIDPLGSMVTYQ